MEYKFKQIKLSNEQKLWLTEILKLNFSRFDVKSLRVKLWEKLPENFDPDKIDYWLAYDNHLTLIGLWHVDPRNSLFGHISKVVEIVKNSILKNPTIKEVKANEIAVLAGITEREAEIALRLLFDIGGFFGSSSGSSTDYGCKQVSFPQNDHAYDKFLTFKNLEQEIEQYFIRCTFHSREKNERKFGNTFLQKLMDFFKARPLWEKVVATLITAFILWFLRYLWLGLERRPESPAAPNSVVTQMGPNSVSKIIDVEGDYVGRDKINVSGDLVAGDKIVKQSLLDTNEINEFSESQRALGKTEYELEKTKREKQELEKVVEAYKRDDKERRNELERAENIEKTKIIVKIFQEQDKGNISKEEASKLSDMVNKALWEDLKSFLENKNVKIDEHNQSLVVSGIFKTKIREPLRPSRLGGAKIVYVLTPEGNKLYEIAKTVNLE